MLQRALSAAAVLAKGGSHAPIARSPSSIAAMACSARVATAAMSTISTRRQNTFGGSLRDGGFFRKQQPLPMNTIIKFVPQQQAWVVERFGRFDRILQPGLAILLPFVDEIRYVKTLKEVTVEVPTQSAITQDNVALSIDGVLYYRVVDPYKACYGVEDADFAITQLAQTTMRSEIGQLTLDRTLAERSLLNTSIVEAINEAAIHWGIRCLRYEIRDIQPPESVIKAMHSQVSAERQKRALILESEGTRQSAINAAEGSRQAQILASEGDRQEAINRAVGEAEAIVARANATAASIDAISQAIARDGRDAVALMVAEKYVAAFGEVAQKSTTMLLPANVSDPAAMIAQAVGIFSKVTAAPGKNTGA